mgnify:CR=1 FL=1
MFNVQVLNAVSFESNGKGGAYIQLGFYVDGGFVALNNIQCAGKAEAHAISLAGKIGLKKTGNIFFTDTTTIIADGYTVRFIIRLYCYG